MWRRTYRRSIPDSRSNSHPHTGFNRASIPHPTPFA